MFRNLFILLLIFVVSGVSSVLAQPQLLPGWPVDNGAAGNVITPYNPAPLTLTEDSDGSLIILASAINEVYAFSVDGQATDDGFSVEGVLEGLDYISCGPLVGEFNNEAGPDVIVAVRNLDGTGRGILAYSDGVLIENLTLSFDQDYADTSGIVVVNVDADPLDEIMFTAEGQLFVKNADGSNVEGFPYPVIDSDPHPYATPALYQWPQRESVFFWVSADNQLHAKIYDADGELEGFPVNTDEAALGSPVIIPTGISWRVAIASSESLYLWEDDGTAVTGYPVNLTGNGIIPQSLCAADQDGDGFADLIFKCEDSSIQAFDQFGQSIAGFPVNLGLSHSSEPFIALKSNATSTATNIFGNNNSETEAGVYSISEIFDENLLNITSNSSNPILFTACTIPMNGFFFLAMQSLQGYTSLYSVTFESNQPRLEWPMPANNSGGNRLYNPVLIEVASPVLNFIPDEIDFGELEVGEFGETQIVVENSGDATGTIYSGWVSANISDEVIVETTLPLSIEAGQSEVILISWIPETAGSMFGEITFNHNDPSHNNAEVVSVNGYYLIPVLEFNPTLVDFGELQDGDTGEAEIIVSNNGTASGIVSEFSVPDEIAAEISVESLPLNIDADSGDTLLIVWTPTQTTELRDILTFTHNDPAAGNTQNINLTGSYVSVIRSRGNDLPSQFMVSPNYPNPFNPTTHLKVSLPGLSSLEVVVYNSIGQKVQTVNEDYLQTGYYSILVDLSEQTSGVYFYQVNTNYGTSSGKMVLIK